MDKAKVEVRYGVTSERKCKLLHDLVLVSIKYQT